MAAIEDIYSQIIRVGVLGGLCVVPEFSVATKGRTFKKTIDVVWLESRNDRTKVGALRRWKIVAAFEVEGYDVSAKRIQNHSLQFSELHGDEGGSFPSYVVLYNEAFHRINPNWGSSDPSKHISKRINQARTLGDVVSVKDGRQLDWLTVPASVKSGRRAC